MCACTNASIMYSSFMPNSFAVVGAPTFFSASRTYLHSAPCRYDIMMAPTTAKELGIKDEYIIEALVQAHKINPERYTILGDTGLTYEAAERLATITGVI